MLNQSYTVVQLVFHHFFTLSSEGSDSRLNQNKLVACQLKASIIVHLFSIE